MSEIPYGDFTQLLQRNLMSSSARIKNISSPNHHYILHVLQENFTQTIAGAYTSGSAQFSTVTYHFAIQYQLRNEQNKIVFGPTTLACEQAQQINGNQMLSMQNTARLIKKELARNLVTQLVNQLMTLKNLP